MRCTLFNDFRHQKEILFAHRRVLQHLVRNIAVSHSIDALFHFHWDYRRHWVDSVDIHFAELLDKCQHGIELSAEMLKLALRHGDTGEMRNSSHSSRIDGHKNPWRAYLWRSACL